MSALPPFPLLGRAGELSAILTALNAADQGKGRTLFVVGEDGVGKSRLIDAAVARATEQGFTVARGRAFSVESGVPYAVFGDALLPLLRGLESSVLTLLSRGGADDLVQLFPALGASRQPGRAERGDPAENKARLLWTFAQFLGRYAAKHPLMLVLENLHFADSASLELLHFVSRQIGGDRILLVASHRAAGPNDLQTLRSAEQSLRELGAAESIALEPWPEQAVVELVQQVFAIDHDEAAEFGRRLHAWTGGNPFFVEETLKGLVAGGRLSKQQSRWTGFDTSDLGVSRTVREAVLARLTELTPTARSIADLMAVLAFPASHDAIGAASGLDSDRLLSAMDELCGRGILIERSAGIDVVYEFAHPIYQDALYAALGLARARALHGQVAESLESLHGPDAMRHAEELAFHFSRADTRQLASKTVQYLQAAGRSALAKHADREAASYLSTALTLADRDGVTYDGEIFDLIQDLSRAKQRMGEYGDALALLDRARRAAEQEGATARLASIHRRMGLACYWSGQYPEALQHYDAAIRAAMTAGERAVEARVHVAKATCLQSLGRRDDARAEVEAALAIAEALDEAALLARVHRALMLLHVWTGPPELAREHGERAIAYAMRSGDTPVTWSAHWALSMLNGLTGDSAGLSRHLSEAKRLAEDLRSPLLRVWTAEVEIEYLAGTGEWDRAIALAEHTTTTARAFGQRTLLPRVLVWLGLLHLGRGDVERGQACVDEAWELSGAGDQAGRVRDVHTVVPAHIGRAALHLVNSDNAGAIRVGERGLAIADRSGYVIWAIHRLVPLIAEASLWALDLDRAKVLGARLRQESTQIGQRLGLAWAAACDALVEMLEGNAARAVDLLREAIAGLEAIPYVADAARLRRQLARALAEAGDRDGATRELRKAHEVFAYLGAQRELDATREQLRELGARPPVRSLTPGVAGLTGREIEIIRLVALRRSNKEIGTALGISARTASTHLSNIFAKLSVASRGELADRARAAGLIE